MVQTDISLENLKFDKYPQSPHGGKLVNRVLTGAKREAAIEKAATLPTIMVDLEAVITLEMIATGVLSPNDGFMVEADYNSVLREGRLASGVVWPTPLSFAPIGNRNKEIIAGLSVGDEITLANEKKEPIAIMKLDDIFDYDKNNRASHLFGTTDRNHPGVDSIFRRMGDTALGGPISLIDRVDWGPFEKIRMEPKDTWHLFYEEKKFRSTAGFITGANPLHRGHEYIHKNALEEIDGLFLQPLVEMAKREYTRHEFRMLAYKAVIEEYYPKDRSILAPLRVTYIFAGPREAILHALIMKNYGCTHALIGRDHAGVGDYYNKYEAHNIFDEYTPEELGIDIRLFHEVFYCTRCSTPATAESCPHDNRYRINISGTGIRELLRHGMLPPKEIVRPESARIAIQGIQPKGIDESLEAISPIGKTIKSLFPFYIESSRIGGELLEEARDWKQLDIRDLKAAMVDVRSNADQIYSDIYEAFSFNADTNRSVQPEWRADAREAMRHHQEMVIEDLEEKVKLATENTSDEFMYQDKLEAERELEVAKQILADMPKPLRSDHLEYRTWNPLPYHRYRGADEE
jgi:sulfate adenylyltransferase